MKYLFCGWALFACSCTGSSVLKATRTSILDEKFIMGPKRYKIYIAALAKFTSLKGRYTISGDTIYLLGKKNGQSWPLKGYAFPDTSNGVITYKRLDSNYTQAYRILHYRPAR